MRNLFFTTSKKNIVRVKEEMTSSTLLLVRKKEEKNKYKTPKPTYTKKNNVRNNERIKRNYF